MKKLLCGAPLLLMLATGNLLAATTVEGVTLPDTVELGGTTLVLNGAGLREKLWVDVYVGGLYLPKKATTLAAVLAEPGPSRIVMHMLYNVSHRQFADAWSDDFEDNNSKAEFAAIKDRLATFNSYFTDSKKGQEIFLDYVPGTGTQVTFAGEVKGTIPGDDFHAALMRVFLGEDPPTKALKRGMLGLPED